MPEDAAQYPCQLQVAPGPELRLTCLLPFRAEGGVAAHLGGVELARLPLEGAIAPGAELVLRPRWLPQAALPAEIRFSTAAGTVELAPPLALASASAAAALFGPGHWLAEQVRIELGLLRGLLRNERNGMAEPVAYARLNTVATRPLVLRPAVPLPEGGCLWPFELALLPEDLMESGMTLTLHVAGQQPPLASLAWGRAWAGTEAAQMVALEARVAELERNAQARLAQLAEEQQRLHLEQRERIDAFIEYAGALLLDRAAEAEAAPGREALRAVLAPPAPPPPAPAPDRVAMGPEAGSFGFGWHPVETEGKTGTPFRWMASSGQLTSPRPGRAVVAVEIETLHLWGAREPQLRATLGEQELAVSFEAGEGAGRFRIRLVPPRPVPAQALRLESLASGSPAQGGGSADARVLSLAVRGVAFEFAPEP
jgi:hypothetical protein